MYYPTFYSPIAHEYFAFTRNSVLLHKLLLSAGLLYDYAQRTIYGNYTGSRKDMSEMLDFSVKHNIEVVAEVFPFSKINEAIEIVRSGRVQTKIVLKN